MRLTPSKAVFIALGLLATMNVVGCQARTPAAQVVIPPSSTAPEAPEAIEKGNPPRGRGGEPGARKARIVDFTLVFTPPAQWDIRKQSGVTIVQASMTGAALALAGVESLPGDAKEEDAAKDTVLAELAKQLELGAIRQSLSWKKPDDIKVAAGLRIKLWSLEQVVSRGSAKGPLLVAWIPTGEGKGVIGLAFVPDDDKSQADVAILKAIQSIEPPR